MEDSLKRKIIRRVMLCGLIVVLPVFVLAYSAFIEPEWLVVKEVDMGSVYGLRLIHITDFHFKGNARLLNRVVNLVNELNPDVVCFTGDIVEDAAFLPEALEILSKIQCPVVGVPGNHDYWGGCSFQDIQECFESTGGRWLTGGIFKLPGFDVILSGSASSAVSVGYEAQQEMRNRQASDYNPVPTIEQITNSMQNTAWPGISGNEEAPIDESCSILLTHYPSAVDHIKNKKYALILAGHSHGGQVRLPFLGALILPFGVGEYDNGLYHTQAGPLYVNPGIGTYHLPFRFLCRPEITLIKM